MLDTRLPPGGSTVSALPIMPVLLCPASAPCPDGAAEHTALLINHFLRLYIRCTQHICI